MTSRGNQQSGRVSIKKEGSSRLYRWLSKRFIRVFKSIGDILLSIKKFLKQNFCIHKYKYDGYIDTYGAVFNFQKCTKCGKLRIIK